MKGQGREKGRKEAGRERGRGIREGVCLRYIHCIFPSCRVHPESSPLYLCKTLKVKVLSSPGQAFSGIILKSLTPFTNN